MVDAKAEPPVFYIIKIILNGNHEVLLIFLKHRQGLSKFKKRREY